MTKNNRTNKFVLGLAALAITLGVNVAAFDSPSAEAFSLKKAAGVIDTVKEQDQIKKSLNFYENEGRHELFEAIKKEDGVNNDPGYNQMLDRIMKKLSAGVAVSDPSINDKPYNYFVNPEEFFNAYCTLGHNVSVNTGVFYFFNGYEDGVASVVAHEIAHGQKNHPIAGAKKKMTVDLVTKIAGTAINSNGIIAADVLANQVKTVGVTRKNETEADTVAFTYMVDAGYNIGAPAMVWQRVIEFSGDPKSKGALDDILNPSTHPESTTRRDAYAKLLTEYSNKKIAVDAKTGEVKVNGKVLIRPASTESMSGAQRSYIVAGNLARVYHNGGTISVARNDNGTLKIGDRAIVTPVKGDPTTDELVTLFNSIK